MMNADMDHYAVLGVKADDDQLAIKKAYKKLALMCHPDKSRAPDAADQFQLIRESYEILSDPNKKALYDYRRGLHTEPIRLNPGSEMGGPAAGRPSQRRGSRHNGRRESVHVPVPQTALVCTLEELFAGFRKRLKITRTLELADGQRSKVSAVVTVVGEPGWQPGHTVTFVGAIADVPEGVEPQDVQIVIQQAPHPSFQRDGDCDLRVTVHVPLLNALFGHTCFLDLIDGTKLSVPIFSVAPGMVMKFPGQGMPRYGAPGQRGDLTVIFEVDMPDAESGEAAHAKLPDWREAPVVCTQCLGRFRECDNHEDACMVHPGSVVGEEKVDVFSHAGEIHVKRLHRAWSCCGERPQASAGCTPAGRHVADPEQLRTLHERVALQGLMLAVRSGNTFGAARSLIACREADLTAPLMMAVKAGHFLCAVLLLRAGANADANNLGGARTALEAAAMRDKQLCNEADTVFTSHSDLVRVLAAIPCVPGLLFQQAVRRLDRRLAIHLLSHELFGPDRCGITQAPALLLHAVRTADAELVALLLESGVEVDHVDSEQGVTALHVACARSDPDISMLIVAHGARTCMRDKQGRRPIDLLLLPADSASSVATAGSAEAPVNVDITGSGSARVTPEAMQTVAVMESAMVDEALHCMHAITLLRVIYDRVLRVQLSRPALRPTLIVLEDALRTVCTDLTDGLDLAIAPATDDSCLAAALKSYEAWRDARADGDCHSCAHEARLAVAQLIAAGVFCKRSLQEEISGIDESLLLMLHHK